MPKTSSADINYIKSTYIIVYSQDNITRENTLSKTSLHNLIHDLQNAANDKCTIIVCP